MKKKNGILSVLLILTIFMGLMSPMGIGATEKKEVTSFDQITSPEFYKLIQDIIIPSTMIINKGESYSIDLNGHQITSNVGLSHDRTTSIIENFGSLLVEDTSAEKNGLFLSDALFGIRNYGSLIINGGNFKSDIIGYKIINEGNYSSRLIRNEGTGSLTINGGHFESKGGPLNTRPGSNTTINNGTFISTSSSRDEVEGETGFYTYCITNGGKMTIKNATVKGVQGALGGFTGELYVYGGDYSTDWNNSTSHYGVYIAGEIGVAKGYIYGGRYSSPKYAAYIGNDGDGGDKRDANVTISGGEFVGKLGAVSVANLTAKDPQFKGGYYYTAKSAEGNKTVDIKVKPYLQENYTLNEETGQILAINPETFKLNHENLALKTGETSLLTASLTPTNLVDNTVHWLSNNMKVATVDNNGKVTAIAEGTATITATAGDKSATCVITVTKVPAPVVDVPTIDTTTPPKEVIVGVQDKASQKVISDTVNSILGDITSGKDISKDVMSSETLKAVKEALAAGKTVSPKVNAKTVDIKSVDKTIVSQVNELVKKLMKTNNTKATVAQYLDLGVLLMADSSELGSVNQLDKPIEFTVGLPTDLAKAGRVFYVVRIHNGVAEKLATKMNSKGTLTFETDKFSSYAIVYEDGIVKTSDDTNILPLITMLGFGMFVGIRNLFKLEDE